VSESSINFGQPNPEDVLKGNYLKIGAEVYSVDSYELETPTRVRVSGIADGRHWVRRWEVQA